MLKSSLTFSARNLCAWGCWATGTTPISPCVTPTWLKFWRYNTANFISAADSAEQKAHPLVRHLPHRPGRSRGARAHERITARTPTIFVKFSLANNRTGAAVGAYENISWLSDHLDVAANLAIAVHPDLEYIAVDTGNEVLVVAADLAPALLSSWGLAARKFSGLRGAEGAVCRHPGPRLPGHPGELRHPGGGHRAGAHRPGARPG